MPVNAIALRSGDFVRVHGQHDWQFELPVRADPDRDDHTSLVDVRAPMTGRIVSVLVHPGDRVGAGSCLATMEAMKMEHSLEAAQASMVTSVMCKVGRQVREGELLITLDPIQ